MLSHVRWVLIESGSPNSYSVKKTVSISWNSAKIDASSLIVTAVSFSHFNNKWFDWNFPSRTEKLLEEIYQNCNSILFYSNLHVSMFKLHFCLSSGNRPSFTQQSMSVNNLRCLKCKLMTIVSWLVSKIQPQGVTGQDCVFCSPWRIQNGAIG